MYDEERQFIKSFSQLKAAAAKSVISFASVIESFPSRIGIDPVGKLPFSKP
jgi:hypothetical protein